MKFDDKVAVITGAASGIGAACARAFSARGARVVAVDIDATGAERVADDIGGLGVACDISNEAAMRDAVSRVESQMGPVDLFFSNAGIVANSGPLDTSDDVWARQWQVNVMSHVYALRAVLPGMLERGSGYLVHTASMAGILSSPGDLPYAMTKHAVVGLAEWLAFTYHDRGIRTSLLAPLGVQTPLLEAMVMDRALAGPVKSPGEVASLVVSAIEEERFLILTDSLARKWMEGKTLDLDRWLHGMREMQARFDAG